MPSLLDVIAPIVADAFEAAGVDRSFGTVEPSRRPELGQFQANGAMAAAKAARQNPRAIADKVVEALKANDLLTGVTVAGPGFINLSLTDDFLARRTDAVTEDPRLGVAPKAEPETVVLDFGGPNVAKAMHVGHLRSSVIGESLKRLLRFVGDKVVSDIHMGDWGLQMGLLIAEIRRRQPNLPYFDESYTGPYPAESPVTLDDLQSLYPEASARSKEDEAFREEARRATAELQAGRPGYRALWQHFVDATVASLKPEFAALGVEFDLWHGESTVNDRIEPMVRRLREQGFAYESEGAVVVDVASGEDPNEIPPLILIKRDGAAMYGTTDLATIEERVEELHPDRILYVVDQRQHLHFEQVFRAARRTGIADGAEMEHLGFGTVNGPDGKPFKTRAGGVMRLADLIGMATDEAMKRLDEAGLATELPAEERAEIARRVGIAAVKFADLSTYRTSDYIFDLERFTRFEGKTGPYMQYAAVRIKSLLAKAAERGFAPGTVRPPETDAERQLMLQLGMLPDAVEQAYGRRAPNALCDFAWELSSRFNGFYQSCHILSETDEARRGSRLALCQATLRQIERVLDLLGIEIPDRM